MNYFRITAYSKENNFCFIVDSNGMFEKLWQFSAFLVSKGFSIIEASSQEKMIDINLSPVEEDTKHIYLRATAEGIPEYIDQIIDGITYKAIKVANKIYIPNKENK